MLEVVGNFTGARGESFTVLRDSATDILTCDCGLVACDHIRAVQNSLIEKYGPWPDIAAMPDAARSRPRIANANTEITPLPALQNEKWICAKHQIELKLNKYGRLSCPDCSLAERVTNRKGTTPCKKCNKLSGTTIRGLCVECLDEAVAVATSSNPPVARGNETPAVPLNTKRAIDLEKEVESLQNSPSSQTANE